MIGTFIAVVFTIVIIICALLAAKDKTPKKQTKTDILGHWGSEEQRRLDAMLYRRSRLF